MDASGSGTFGQTIIGIILVMGENFFPFLNQTGRDGLGANVHQTPLIQMVIFELNFSALDRKKDIQRPGNQKPDYGYLFFGNGLHDPLGFDSFKDNAPGAYNEIAEPVHLGSGVIQGRNTKEIIPVGLTVM
jgi:hypothetical protein